MSASGPKWRRLLPGALIAFLLVVIAFLVWARLRGGEDLRESWASLDLRWLPVALGLHVSAHIFWAARLSVLAKPNGVPLGFFAAWRVITAGVFGGAVTPGRLGGEALKLTVLVRRRYGAAASSRLLLLDRAADLIFFLVLGFVALALLPPYFGVEGQTAQAFALAGSVVLFAFLCLAAWILAAPRAAGRMGARIASSIMRLVRRKTSPELPERAGDFLVDVREGMGTFALRHPFRTVAAFVLTGLNWIAEYAVLWVILHAFGYTIPYAVVFLVGIVLTLIANIPITPGGTGTAEVAAYALLAPLAPGLTILFPAVWRSMTYLYDVVVGGLVATGMVPGLLRRPKPGRADEALTD